MKKLLSLVALAGIMASCNNTKEDKTETKTGDTTVTTTPTTVEPTTSVETPKFSDPEVQKFVDDYAAFWNDYKTNWNDPAKAQEYSQRMTDWSTKSQSIGMKLANNPDDLKKWNDWWAEMAKKMQEMMPTGK